MDRTDKNVHMLVLVITNIFISFEQIHILLNIFILILCLVNIANSVAFQAFISWYVKCNVCLYFGVLANLHVSYRRVP